MILSMYKKNLIDKPAYSLNVIKSLNEATKFCILLKKIVQNTVEFFKFHPTLVFTSKLKCKLLISDSVSVDIYYLVHCLVYLSRI